MTAKKTAACKKVSGTKEWAPHNLNISVGCSHNCLYCYAAADADRRKLKERSEWACEKLTKKAEMASFPVKHDGRIMFPSTHDITPGILEAAVKVLKVVIAAGNEVLIVTKPHLMVVDRLVKEFADPNRRDEIEFRFTIGTLSPSLSKFWEPGAPLPEERIAALKLAHSAGYKTSVSMEPLLGGIDTATAVVTAVHDYVTETIWIGKMNQIRNRVRPSSVEKLHMVNALEQRQTDAEILQIYEAFQNNPMVRWKDSICDVLRKYAVKQ